MVAAYSTFANQGVYIKPQVITRIEDKNGVVLYEAVPESHDVLNKDIAYAVIKLLEGVTESGSGGRLRTDGGGFGYEMMTGYPYVLRNPIAGKREQLKINPTVGLLVWFQIWQLVYGLETKTVLRTSKVLPMDREPLWPYQSGDYL